MEAGGRDPYEILISDIMSRIKRTNKPLGVFAIGRTVRTCLKQSHQKFHKLEKEGTLIGVYTGAIDRHTLSADISMVVDEVPEPDEIS